MSSHSFISSLLPLSSSSSVSRFPCYANRTSFCNTRALVCDERFCLPEFSVVYYFSCMCVCVVFGFAVRCFSVITPVFVRSSMMIFIHLFQPTAPILFFLFISFHLHHTRVVCYSSIPL
ncbi:hypothetical protein CSKR_201087 [Clonorchis sinensis]|uniref:Uncharacterized protein n=1 Tax=Clonorchis sinensis TaxID=79923 RepID=A0A8T1MMB4_CLOSI|nr:hypothetical protein CSKR_201087 [Clonorchis sinensis]